jgi:hypothetical protein
MEFASSHVDEDQALRNWQRIDHPRCGPPSVMPPQGTAGYASLIQINIGNSPAAYIERA